MKGRMTVGILFKHAPLLSVYPFFYWFFNFPLSFFFVFSFPYLDLELCSQHSESERYFLSSTIRARNLQCASQDRHTWLNGSDLATSKSDGIRYLLSSPTFYFLPPILHPYPWNESDSWSYLYTISFPQLAAKILDEVFTNIQVLWISIFKCVVSFQRNYCMTYGGLTFWTKGVLSLLPHELSSGTAGYVIIIISVERVSWYRLRRRGCVCMTSHPVTIPLCTTCCTIPGSTIRVVLNVSGVLWVLPFQIICLLPGTLAQRNTVQRGSIKPVIMVYGQLTSPTRKETV